MKLISNIDMLRLTIEDVCIVAYVRSLNMVDSMAERVLTIVDLIKISIKINILEELEDENLS